MFGFVKLSYSAFTFLLSGIFLRRKISPTHMHSVNSNHKKKMYTFIKCVYSWQEKFVRIIWDCTSTYKPCNSLYLFRIVFHSYSFLSTHNATLIPRYVNEKLSNAIVIMQVDFDQMLIYLIDSNRWKFEVIQKFIFSVSLLFLKIK